jgi:hypothetical protein
MTTTVKLTVAFVLQYLDAKQQKTAHFTITSQPLLHLHLYSIKTLEQ